MQKYDCITIFKFLYNSLKQFSKISSAVQLLIINRASKKIHISSYRKTLTESTTINVKVYLRAAIAILKWRFIYAYKIKVRVNLWDRK